MIKLKVKKIDVETGGIPIVSLNKKQANELDIHPMDRVELEYKGKKTIVAVDISELTIKYGEIGIFEDVSEKINVKNGEDINIKLVGKPDSVQYIRMKMDKEELTKEQTYSIIRDVVNNKLTDVELAAFVSACYISGMSLEETEYLTRAIVDTGGVLKLKTKPILDKHSIGGVPGNRVTMVLVPTIASMGYTIPKTSSRSITSPSGTADTMEVLANVSFSIEELKGIIKKVGGFIVWGGAINLAAADDKLIRIRHPLSLDPEGMMLASIVAKKAAVSSTDIVFDLPIGNEAKLHSLGEGRHLEYMFHRLASRFNMKIDTVITDGSQPIGNGIGPALEARDILYLLQDKRKKPVDLLKKSALLIKHLLWLVGKKQTEDEIIRYIKRGKPYKKMKQIIKAQGGDPKIKPEDIGVGKYTLDYKAERSGRIDYISNLAIEKIARTAGAPNDKEAGMYIHKKIGDKVRYGQKIFTVYSNSEMRLDEVIKILNRVKPVKII